MLLVANQLQNSEGKRVYSDNLLNQNWFSSQAALSILKDDNKDFKERELYK